jgi:hypothetical protein
MRRFPAVVTPAVALDALTLWRDVESGEPCACSCHPRLPESDFHDYGFGCVCARTAEDRRRALDKWRNDIEAWLATQRGVVVHGHGGFAPEQWRGKVDGHTFYFRERGDVWRIEPDMRPSGRFARAFVGTQVDGEARYEERELDEGDVIACGTTDVDGYGTTPVERARFIVDTIRVPLARARATYTWRICRRSKHCSAARSAGAQPAAPVCRPTDERRAVGLFCRGRAPGRRAFKPSDRIADMRLAD